MTLPPRQTKKAKRSERWRSQQHLRFVREFHCAILGCQGVPIECAHVRIGSGAGMGQKPDDWRVVPLCKHHHIQQHTIGERTFWQNYERSTGQDVEDLIQAICNASPKARDIAIRKKELGL
jgi:hypothetical protein